MLIYFEHFSDFQETLTHPCYCECILTLHYHFDKWSKSQFDSKCSLTMIGRTLSVSLQVNVFTYIRTYTPITIYNRKRV